MVSHYCKQKKNTILKTSTAIIKTLHKIFGSVTIAKTKLISLRKWSIISCKIKNV